MVKCFLVLTMVVILGAIGLLGIYITYLFAK